MTDLFEDDEEEVVLIESTDQFTDLEVEPEVEDIPPGHLDARRRLESVLEEKRLREELDDFVDY